MLGLMLSLKKILNYLLGFVLIVLVAVLTCDVLWGIISRFLGRVVSNYAMDTGWAPWGWLPTGQSNWTAELAEILLIWVSLLGASVAFGAKAHLGVDYFVGKLDKDAQRLMEIIVHIIVMFFAGFVMVWGGYQLVSETLISGQLIASLGIKQGYIYLALPISGLFIIMYSLEGILEVLVGEKA